MCGLAAAFISLAAHTQVLGRFRQLDGTVLPCVAHVSLHPYIANLSVISPIYSCGIDLMYTSKATSVASDEGTHAYMGGTASACEHCNAAGRHGACWALQCLLWVLAGGCGMTRPRLMTFVMLPVLLQVLCCPKIAWPHCSKTLAPGQTPGSCLACCGMLAVHAGFQLPAAAGH